MKNRYLKIKKSIIGMTKEEAVADLENRIFLEEMNEFMDFEFIEICERIIKELKERVE